MWTLEGGRRRGLGNSRGVINADAERTSRAACCDPISAPFLRKAREGGGRRADARWQEIGTISEKIGASGWGEAGRGVFIAVVGGRKESRSLENQEKGCATFRLFTHKSWCEG